MDGRRNSTSLVGHHKTPRSGRARDWRQSLAACLWAGLILLAAVLYSRHFTDGLEVPRSAFSACLVAVVALAPSLFALSLCRSARRNPATKTSRTIWGLLTIAPPLALAVAFLPSGTSWALWFLAAVFGLVAMSVAFAADRTVTTTATDFTREWPVPVSVRRSHAVLRGSNQTRAIRTLAAAVLEQTQEPQDVLAGKVILPADNFTPPIVTPIAVRNDFATMESEEEPRDCTQQLLRMTSPSGQDVLEGSIKVAFAAGQRQVNVHIPFVPPFSTVPSVECETLDDCELRLHVGTVQTFGTRIEVKRTSDIHIAATAEIGFAAVISKPTAHAA